MFVTPNGKEIEIVRNKNGRDFSVKFVGGGEAPEEFNQIFTNHMDAESTIRAYLTKVEGFFQKKGTRVGKSNSE